MIELIKRNKITALILAAIFLFALYLRVVNLEKYPVGFQIDEASLGYNAYSILLTGKSEAGMRLPLYVDTFGDNRPTGYNFFAIPSVKVFGLTIFATRLPGALFGALTVIPIFLLSYTLFRRRLISLFSAFLVSASPWNVVLSRASAETIIALFFITLGFYFIFDYVRKAHNWKLVFGSLNLALSFFFYHTPRIFVPMFFFIFLLVWHFPYKKLEKKTLLRLGVSFVFLCVVSFLLIFVVKGGTGRFSQVNIFSFPETRLVMNEQIREDGVFGARLLETRVMHNKIVNFSWTFINNYFAYFSGDFLFMNGGLPIWYKVERVGLLLLIEFPFILYGGYLCVKSKDRFAKLPLFWILASPAVAAITVDDIPNLQRAIVLFPMLEILAAVGTVRAIQQILNIKFKILNIHIKYLIFALFFLFFIFNFSYFLHQYFVHGKMHRTWYRNNGVEEMMKIVNQNYNKYDKIVTTKTGGGYPLFLFFSKYDPATYQKEGSPKDADYKGFGKFIFVPNDCPSINLSINLPVGTKVLSIDRGTCNPPSVLSQRKYTEIKKEDGTLGFRIVY